MLDFGGQTVTFIANSEGTKDAWGIPNPVPSTVDVGGVHFRPLSATEVVALTDLGVAIWQLTAPPVAAVLDAKLNGQLSYNGDTFEIFGSPMPFTDASGELFKVTVMYRKQQKKIV